MTRSPAEPVPSATLLLVRDGRSGLEVFMVKRHHRIDFVPGAMVFPGGKVDPGDRDAALQARCLGTDTLPPDELVLRVAAIREAFEECGVLLARPAGEAGLVPPARLRELDARHREALHAGRIGLRAVVEQEDLELACDLPVPFAHWITPEFMKRRFDTHFFLVPAPPDQVADHDGRESVDSVWISPAQAIAEERADRLNIIFPTLMNLELLGRSPTVAEAVAAARRRPVVTVLPRVRQTEAGAMLCIPPEAGYALTEAPVESLRGA
jgi:8-oxo-dGTP pyrophosphatase MutT (NUDIX family)